MATKLELELGDAFERFIEAIRDIKFTYQPGGPASVSHENIPEFSRSVLLETWRDYQTRSGIFASLDVARESYSAEDSELRKC